GTILPESVGVCWEIWFEWVVRFSETRKPAQKLSRKDLGCNDPKPVITPKATYVPVSKRAGLRS
ncbi:MAG: hypothetical protein ABF494_03920, partial [Lacticaseibacillus paracasei]